MGNCCSLFRKKNYRQISNESIENDSNDYTLEDLSPPIHKLDDQLLAKIFMCLEPDERIAIESVCKRWQKVSATRAWEHEDVVMIMNPPSMNMSRTNELAYTRNHLIRRGQHLKKLLISSLCDTRILQIINKHCPNLTDLYLGLMEYNQENLHEAFSNMKNLRVLDIRNLYDIPDNLFNEIQKISGSIEIIGFYRGESTNGGAYYKFPPHSFAPTFENFDSLRALTVEDYKLSFDVMQVISKKNNLSCLKLINCEFENKACIELILQLNNLEYLNLLNVAEVDDDYLGNLANECKNLRQLCLSFCNISDSGVSELTKLKNLEALAMRNQRGSMLVTDLSIQNFSNLKCFYCAGNGAITNLSIKKILENSPDLEKLDVSFTLVDHELISYAAALTKTRTNNIKLNILVSFGDVFTASKYSSPFLVVKRYNK